MIFRRYHGSGRFPQEQKVEYLLTYYLREAPQTVSVEWKSVDLEEAFI